MHTSVGLRNGVFNLMTAIFPSKTQNQLAYASVTEQNETEYKAYKASETSFAYKSLLPDHTATTALHISHNTYVLYCQPITITGLVFNY